MVNANGSDIKSDAKRIHLGQIIGPNVKTDVILDVSYSFTASVNSV